MRVVFCLFFAFTFCRNAFKTNRVMEVSFELSENNWSNLTADPLALLDKDLPANVTYDGIYRENISIRLEGKAANEFCVARNSSKFSWVIDTGERIRGESDNTIQGSRIIFVRNSYNDPSFMREMLASYILDDASRTSRISYINLTLIIGDSTIIPQGLYLVEEKVDAHFVKHRYELSKGDLFQVNYPAGTLAFYGDRITQYPNLTVIDSQVWDEGLSYIRMVDKIRDTPLNETELEGIANMDSIMFHLAICSMLGVYNGASGVADNFFVYFETYSIKDYGKGQLIAAEFTETFGIPTCRGSLSTADIIERDIAELQCRKSQYYNFQLYLLQTEAEVNREEILLLNILLDHETYRTLYYSKLQLVLDYTFTEYFIQATIDYNRFTIEEYVKESESQNFYSYDEFLCSIEDPTVNCTSSSIVSIQEYVRQRSASVTQQLATNGWQKPEPNKATSLAVTMLLTLTSILLIS